MIAMTLDSRSVIAALDGLSLGGAGLTRRLTNAAEEAGAYLEALARAGAPVGVTGLTKSTHGHKLTMVNGLPGVVVGPSAAHAYFAHEGRKPGRPPPPGALAPWMSFKGMDPGVVPAGGGWARPGEFNLAMKIGRKGTKGKPWLTEAFQAGVPTVLAIYRKHLG